MGYHSHILQCKSAANRFSWHLRKVVILAACYCLKDHWLLIVVQNSASFDIYYCTTLTQRYFTSKYQCRLPTLLHCTDWSLLSGLSEGKPQPLTPDNHRCLHSSNAMIAGSKWASACLQGMLKLWQNAERFYNTLRGVKVQTSLHTTILLDLLMCSASERLRLSSDASTH